ncbi:hypothetical protein A2U01_0078445 [Trifolium medium]|uniref:Uncharacterized protein n=1 Tax=Trifolium medium TaxID=97028 RepID=A0A392T9K1_9FABA|nr:hypothetical protein [Trifolium medium]
MFGGILWGFKSKPPQFSHVMSYAQRADACCAARSSCCEGGLVFWRWRGAQLGLVQRAVQWYKGRFSSGVCATHS